MTTTGQPVTPGDDNAYAALLEIYREQAEALLIAGVDLFAVETMMGVTECMAAGPQSVRHAHFMHALRLFRRQIEEAAGPGRRGRFRDRHGRAQPADTKTQTLPTITEPARLII